jgi:hypothetical protein
LGADEDLKVSDYDSMFASNVRAPFLLVAAFRPGDGVEAIGQRDQHRQHGRQRVPGHRCGVRRDQGRAGVTHG